MPHLPLSIVSKYHILELVGEGAMGSVYRAHDPVLNRTVAIKVMSDAIARDPSLRDRFMREAQAAGSLQHPNVVTIFDFGEFDGHLFIAMEFVEGVDLEQVIAEGRPLSLSAKLGIVIDVLIGLSYAHKHGIVHRDIKPANIRVLEDGHAKIMDFGVAHLESAKMTATGMMVGTPNYMAPEQVTGGKIGPATDIFSVGAVLFELLAHRKAFSGETLHAVLFKVVSEETPSLSIVAPDVPPELDPVVRRALAKDAEQRYGSAQEMANVLTGIRVTHLGSDEARSLSLSATIASQRAARGRDGAPAPAGRTAAAVGRSRAAIGALVATVLLGGAWLLGRGGDEERPPVVAEAPVAAFDTTSRGDSSPGPLTTPPDVAPAGGASNAPATSIATPPAASSAAPPASPTAREEALTRVVRGAAERARRRAQAAGAASAQLAAGDAELARANRHLAAGRHAAAAAAFEEATALWGEAERSAIAAAAARSAPPPAVVAAPPVVPPVAPSRLARDSLPPAPAVVEAPPVRVSPSPSPAAEGGRGTVSDAAAIGALVAAYARAIEARELAAVRARYPAISAEQERGFARFFASVSALRVTLVSSPPEITGATATSRVSGTYEYVDAGGKPQRQPVGFRATFRREGGEWRIASVR